MVRIITRGAIRRIYRRLFNCVWGSRRYYMQMQRLTIATLMSDIETEWTSNASSTIFSSYRKCSKRRISGRSVQATSLLPIEGTTKCSRIARGFGCGSSSGFAAEVKPKAGFGFRASAAFPASYF